jgi:hypothetical protein
MSKARIKAGAALVRNKPQAQPECIRAGQRPSCIDTPCREPKPARVRREPDAEPLALESSRRSVNAEQSDYEPAITQSPSRASEEPIQSKSSTNQGSAKAQDHTRGKPEQRQCRGSQSQCQIERLSRVMKHPHYPQPGQHGCRPTPRHSQRHGQVHGKHPRVRVPSGQTDPCPAQHWQVARVQPSQTQPMRTQSTP